MVHRLMRNLTVFFGNVRRAQQQITASIQHLALGTIVFEGLNKLTFDVVSLLNYYVLPSIFFLRCCARGVVQGWLCKGCAGVVRDPGVSDLVGWMAGCFFSFLSFQVFMFCSEPPPQKKNKTQWK